MAEEHERVDHAQALAYGDATDISFPALETIGGHRIQPVAWVRHVYFERFRRRLGSLCVKTDNSISPLGRARAETALTS